MCCKNFEKNYCLKSMKNQEKNLHKKFSRKPASNSSARIFKILTTPSKKNLNDRNDDETGAF